MTVIARGVLGAGLLDARVAPDELRRANRKWPVIEALRRCADQLGVSTVQLAIWYVRPPGVDTILVGTTSTANADDAIAAM